MSCLDLEQVTPVEDFVCDDSLATEKEGEIDDTSQTASLDKGLEDRDEGWLDFPTKNTKTMPMAIILLLDLTYHKVQGLLYISGYMAVSKLMQNIDEETGSL